MAEILSWQFLAFANIWVLLKKNAGVTTLPTVISVMMFPSYSQSVQLHIAVLYPHLNTGMLKEPGVVGDNRVA